jgi:methylated-DNA-[protein]-cysteine S-methyltransferase
VSAISAAYATVPSPVGDLVLTAERGHLTGLYLPGQRRPPDMPPASAERDAAPLRAARHQLGEYFAGRRTSFDLPLAPAGTAFRRLVWDELLRVGFGETTTYRELAARIGRPTAVRATGAANGANPISIVIPCHRVIGSGGALTGYGGGLAAKRFLLDLERSRG